MNLDHLNYFKTSVELKSRAAAADRLSITPSTLSLALAKLEQEVGVPLLEKTRGSVELTHDGRVFYEYVSTALRFLDRGMGIIHENHGAEAADSINIGATFSVQDGDWSRIISRFRQHTQRLVQVNVKQSTTPGLIRSLKRGVVDVAFAGTMGADPEIEFFPCWTQRAVLVVNKHHAFARRPRISLSELTNHHLVSYNLTGPLGAELTKLVAGFALSIDYLYSDEITLASIVAGNPDIMAITCRSWLLDSYSSEVSLVEITEAPHDFHQLYLLSLAHIKHPRIVQTFIDEVHAYCTQGEAETSAFVR